MEHPAPFRRIPGIPARPRAATTLGHGLMRLVARVGAVFLVGVTGVGAVLGADGGGTISAARVLEHTRVLASDEFEGRGPGTAGEDRTVAYLAEEFRKLGLKPVGEGGTFFQTVPLVGYTATPELKVVAGGKEVALAFPGECVISSRRFQPEVRLEGSELVFVGYGVVAPEYGWDDYKGVDVAGKTLVMLINDPPVEKEGKPDPDVFRGKAMTYYGRWTYKYEIAREKGAAAVLIIHETGPAGYPYFVLVGSNARENFDLQTGEPPESKLAAEGWLTWEKASEIFAATGKDLAQLKAGAVRRDFRPLALGAKLHMKLGNATRNVKSRNVAGLLEGSDPVLKDEWVIYTAHWDHLGRNPNLQGDQIFNGAQDNAIGVAGMLELARVMATERARPKRSILFLAVTAEEKGLLGAKHYAARPLHPLEKTVANLNLDTLNVWGRTKDLNVIGMGQNTLEDLVIGWAAKQGRIATPDAAPEKGRYYRSDHFEFAKVGVPALYVNGGVAYTGKDPEFALRKGEEYIQRDYHKVTDEVRAEWDLSGAAEDLELLRGVGLEVANGTAWPAWKPGSEFAARRKKP